jgi:hypothetical protein
MPNGDPRSNVKMQELDEFFRTIAEVLTQFAQRHNLKLQKYYHESPSWSFTFRHPKGGVAKIEVARESANTLHLSSSWWYDNYDNATRFARKTISQSLPRTPKVLDSELEKTLSLITSWQFGEWDESHGGNDSWKTNWTKQQFELLLEQYPIPRP